MSVMLKKKINIFSVYMKYKNNIRKRGKQKMVTVKFEDYFFGSKISNEEKEKGYISFDTLFNSLGGGILCNDITKLFYGIEINDEYHEQIQINGDYYVDTFSYYIIPQSSVRYYKSLTDYPIFYIDFLDLYVLGITHYGTNWKNVSSGIQIGKEYILM